MTKLESDTNLATGQTVTLAAPATSGTVAITPDNFGRIFLLNFISGYALTNNGTTGWDVAAGQAADSTNSVMLYGSALTNKTQAAWVAGAAAGGKLMAAAMAVNTWYYWFALWKTVDGTVDYGFDVSTTPTLPTGYTKYRYIGARKTLLAATTWDSFVQHGAEVYWSTPPALDQSATGTSVSRTLVTVNVPALKVNWFGHARAPGGASASNIIYFTDPAVADISPNNTASPLGSVGANSPGTANIDGFGQVRCWTNSAGQVGVRVTNTTPSIQIQTIGWTDPRGNPV